MHAGRDTRAPPGGRPPPKRTYGSKQGSRRVGVRNDQAQNQTLSPTDEATNSNMFSVAPKEQPGLRPELVSNRVTSAETYSSGLRSLARFGAGVRYSTADEVSQLVRSAGQGGEEGRACAIALAQACKSHETRRVIRANGGAILDELTRVILAALRGDGHRQRDEGIIHCLSVALFILSKDRSLGTAFSESVVSILALLIGGEQHGIDVVDEEHSGSRTTTTTATAAVDGVALLPTEASSGSAHQRKPTAMKMTGTLGEQQQSASKAGDGRRWRWTTAVAGQGREADAKGSSSVFDMSEEEEEDKEEGNASGRGNGVRVGEGSADGPGAETTERPPSAFSASSSKGSKVGTAQAVARATEDYGSPKIMVRARMLLDIADILPWGMANRHLVSAADLGLATLLNVAAQACAESGKGGGAAGESTGGGDSESMQDEGSTQGSVGSQSDPPSSAVGAVGDGRASSETAARKAGVMLELGRLAPSGFLLPLVVGGAAVLKELSASMTVDGAGGAAADPSSLKAVHQLLLALRLLDLATLEQPVDGGGRATKEVGAEDARPGQSAKLTDALLLVVARCRPFRGNAKAARRRKESAPDERGKPPAGREMPARQQPLGDEVATRIHECLLAALRVLINITHHDATVCAEVAARGGLKTLMSCLVERCENKDQSAAREGSGRTDSEALLGDLANGGGESVRETSVEDAEGARGGGREDGAETDGGDFDAQILTMGALINCVELKESAKNCAIMANLTAHPLSHASEGSRRGGQLSGEGGLSSKCLAPEFLAKLLVRCTRKFAHQLEGDRPDQGEEEPSSPSPQAKYGSITNGSRGADSTSLEIASKEQSMTPMTAQEVEGEDLMSHAEGADLVLGGHCALLLGLLIREQEGSRCMVLSVLPGGKATLIVRVLEAFIALQYQAGVLTEEVVLAVQLLVEELELMEGLPPEDLNPFELDDEDDVLPSGAPSTHSTSSPRRAQKRPRSPTDTCRVSTPPSGQWAMDDGGNDDPDQISLSVTDPRPTAQGERTSPPWLVQARERGNSRPSGGRQIPSQSTTTSSSSSTLASNKPASIEVSIKIPRDADNADSTPLCQKNRAPGSPESSWRIGGASIGGTSGAPLGLGLGGGSAAGTRSWLGSPQCRTYGGRRSFGRQTWKKPTGALAGLRTSMLGQAESTAGQANTSSDAGNGIGGRVGGGGGVRVGVGPMSGRRRTATGTNPILDLDGWSDSSNETPVKLSGVGAKNAAMEAKRARAACAHYTHKNGVVSNSCGEVGGGGGAAGNTTEVAAQARSEDRRTCALSPRPSLEDDGRRPIQGGGASNGGAGGGKPATCGTAPGAPSAKVRPGPGKARREGNARPQTEGEARLTLYGLSGSALPQRISSQLGLGLDDSRDALRPPLGLGAGARRETAVLVESKAARGVFQVDHAEREDAGGREPVASRNVFEFDEESD